MPRYHLAFLCMADLQQSAEYQYIHEMRVLSSETRETDST